MRKVLLGLAIGAALLVPLPALGATGNATDPEVAQQLAAVRQATAKYLDVAAAQADGYLPDPECAALPGVGGMGFHYFNPRLGSDLAVDLLAPEILLYAPSESGPRLVGVEYFVANVGQPHPSLFGRAFDGPMPGHFPGMPEHYDLHVWLWQANPDGIFAQWNPTVRCSG